MAKKDKVGYYIDTNAGKVRFKKREDKRWYAYNMFGDITSDGTLKGVEAIIKTTHGATQA